MTLIPHSHNKEFSQGRSDSQQVMRLVPPFKAPFHGEQELYQFVAQTLARYKQTCPHDSMLCADVCLDMIEEPRRLGYSDTQISRAFRKQKRDKFTNLIYIVRSALKVDAKREKDMKRKNLSSGFKRHYRAQR